MRIFMRNPVMWTVKPVMNYSQSAINMKDGSAEAVLRGRARAQKGELVATLILHICIKYLFILHLYYVFIYFMCLFDIFIVL